MVGTSNQSVPEMAIEKWKDTMLISQKSPISIAFLQRGKMTTGMPLHQVSSPVACADGFWR